MVMKARPIRYLGIATCVFAGGFWYFVAGLACGLSGAGGCSNVPPLPWEYPMALAYAMPVFMFGMALIAISRRMR